MIRIGLIDDNAAERDDIQTTIYTAWEKSHEITEEVEFRPYPLEPRPDFKETLEKELLLDIDSGQIQSLIVDYKLDSLRKVIAGRDIVEYLSAEVPAFPVIILTNAPNGSKREPAIDPDKVYDKSTFLYLGSDASDEMALKIYLNVKRYSMRRAELETKLAQALEQLAARPEAETDIALLSEIAELEDGLADYTATEKATVEKAMDLSELRGLIGELIELEDKLG